jgi:chromosome segregation ATPase
MDLQAVTVFFELVSNQKKYKAYLDDLQERESQLKKLISAVGEIEEIQKIKTAAIADAETRYAELALYEKTLNEQHAKRSSEVEALLIDVQERINAATLLENHLKNQEALLKQQAIELSQQKEQQDNLIKSFAEFEKRVQEKEKRVNRQLALLKNLGDSE